jgi:hypothetical protein
VYNIRIGNPQLKNSTQHSLNLSGSFYTQNPKSLYSVNSNISAGYRLSLNPVADSVINDFSGKRTYYYINADQSKSLNMNYRFSVSRKLNKNSLQFMYNGQLNNSRLPGYIDGLSNTSETVNLSNQLSLQYSVAELLVVNASQSFQHNKTKQSAAGLRSFENSNNTTRLGAVLNYPDHFTISSTADYISNSNIPRPTILWNAFATYRFMKEQAELKFSAMDLLKKYQNITNGVNSYGTYTRISNGLQQFFLLTFSYYPRKFGKTEVKRQGK